MCVIPAAAGMGYFLGQKSGGRNQEEPQEKILTNKDYNQEEEATTDTETSTTDSGSSQSSRSTDKAY